MGASDHIFFWKPPTKSLISILLFFSLIYSLSVSIPHDQQSRPERMAIVSHYTRPLQGKLFSLFSSLSFGVSADGYRAQYLLPSTLKSVKPSLCPNIVNVPPKGVQLEQKAENNHRVDERWYPSQTRL